MDEKERYQKAEAFATEKHKGQFRIGGEPYIMHPLAVAEIVRNQGYGMDYQITALFHDLLEDTDATEEEIFDLGGARVLEAVRLLTKQEGYVMAEYVAGIRSNPIAFVVKAADRLHNLRTAFVRMRRFGEHMFWKRGSGIWISRMKLKRRQKSSQKQSLISQKQTA